MIFANTIEKKKKNKINKLRSSALDRAEKVALHLRKHYNATRIVLFGSLVRKTYLHEKSDIDLLVEGINKNDFLHAGYDASVIARPFDVDIIPAEIADNKIIEIANEEGIVL